jgi:hypothetical protein
LSISAIQVFTVSIGLDRFGLKPLHLCQKQIAHRFLCPARIFHQRFTDHSGKTRAAPLKDREHLAPRHSARLFIGDDG